MHSLFKIAFNAFRESLREPVYCLMLLASLVLIAGYPALAGFAFMEPLKLVIDSAMATSMLMGLIISVLAASNTVSREMRNGTVLLLLSKPVSRWSFVIGKIIGVTAAATLFVLLCNLGCVISTYVTTDQFRYEVWLLAGFLGVIAAGTVCGMVVNFIRGSSFPEICSYALTVLVVIYAGALLKFGTPPPEVNIYDLCKALVLINFAAAAMSTVAVVASTRLDVVPNLCVCTAVFFMGLLSSYLFRKFEHTESELLKQLLTVLYSIFPNWQFFWLADAVAMKRRIPGSYVLMAVLYMSLFVVIAAMWAVVLFHDKEAAGDSRN